MVDRIHVFDAGAGIMPEVRHRVMPKYPSFPEKQHGTKQTSTVKKSKETGTCAKSRPLSLGERRVRPRRYNGKQETD